MSEQSRRDNIKKELRSLKSLVSDLNEKIKRLEDLIESSDEESSVDTVELQSNGIQIGTVVTFINESDRLGFCPSPLNKYAIVLEATNCHYSAVKSPFNIIVKRFANTDLRVASIQEASQFRNAAR